MKNWPRGTHRDLTTMNTSGKFDVRQGARDGRCISVAWARSDAAPLRCDQTASTTKKSAPQGVLTVPMVPMVLMILGVLLSPGFAWGAAPTLRLYYYDRPPFHYANEQGQVLGIVASATEDALHRAKLQFEWTAMPAGRVLATLREETVPACSPGWYATPERRADFLFSKAMMLDQPLVALVREDYPVPNGITAKALFAMPQVRLLLKQNLTQGRYLEALIARMPPSHIQSISFDFAHMIQMLKARRADVIFSTEAEAGLFVNAAGFSMSDFKILRFPDAPAEEYRYLLCNRSVGAATMERIDKAIVLQKP